MSALWLALRQGYDRRSAAALALALCTYGAVGYHWRNLIRPELGMDWLLAGIWIFMTGLLCWRLQPREDLRLVLVGLCGGAVIEWWGTTTELWRYFTAERPPPWIIPAWPVAALTIHRLPALLRPLWPGLDRLARLYYPLMLGFFVLMARFLWPSVHIFSSQVVLALMLGVTLVRARPDRDVSLFLTGSALGLFLEYWGTSRYCWVYYTKQVPPAEAVLAHGFAAVAFCRAEEALADLTGLRRRV
jgi:hypothetical protein